MRGQALAVLKRAAEILNNGDWTQGSNARRKDGTECSVIADDACAWCLVGALHRAIFEVCTERRNTTDRQLLERRVYAAVHAVLPPWWSSVEGYNDLRGRTKSEVLRVVATAKAVV